MNVLDQCCGTRMSLQRPKIGPYISNVGPITEGTEKRKGGIQAYPLLFFSVIAKVLNTMSPRKNSHCAMHFLEKDNSIFDMVVYFF